MKPDFLFFTGDAAFGHLGSAGGESLEEQLDTAELLFSEVRAIWGIPKERFFMVPGNHDIHRGKINLSDTTWLDSLASQDRQMALDAVQNLLRDDGVQWRSIRQRLDAYRDFLKGHGYAHLLTDEARLTWSWRERVNACDVAIVGLNTAWACGRKEEQGKLWAGLHWQVNTLLSPMKRVIEPDVKIVLTHHSRGWLHPHEDKEAERLLERKFDVWLHGHEHEDWVNEKPRHARVGAGACYARGPQERGYSFGRYDAASKTGQIWLRGYDECNAGWVLRPIAHMAEDGIWYFKHRPPERKSAVSLVPLSTPLPPAGGLRSRGTFGRDKSLEGLARVVKDYPIVSVYGLPGVGKTTLIEELRFTPEHRHRNPHSLVVREATTFQGLFQQLAPALGAGVSSIEAGLAKLGQFSVIEAWSKNAEPSLIHLEQAHHLLDANGQRFRDSDVSMFLEKIARKAGHARIVLECRRFPKEGIFPSELHKAWFLGGLKQQDLGDFFTMPHRSHKVAWQLSDDEINTVFRHLGGDKDRRGNAHPLGMVLLAALAEARGEKPNTVVERHNELFANELETAIFHELYDHVLSPIERRVLQLCALYRDDVPTRHEVGLEKYAGRGAADAFESLLDRCLLRTDNRQERYSLHQMIGDLVRRRLKTAVDIEWITAAHARIGELHLTDAGSLRRLPQIMAASEAVYHLIEGKAYGRLTMLRGLKLRDDAVSHLREISRRLHTLQKYRANRRVLELLVAADETDHKSHRFLAEVIEKIEGRGAAAALPHYERAYELKKDFAPYVNNLMHHLERTDPKRCLMLADRAIEQGIANDYIQAARAKLLEQCGAKDEASGVRQGLIAAGSRNPALYNDEAVFLAEQGRSVEALTLLAQAIESEIANDHTRAIRAKVLEKSGTEGEASRVRQELIAAGSCNAVFYNDEAIFLAQQGRTTEALNLLTQAIERGVANKYITATLKRLERDLIDDG